jgi:hypothetical protein
VTPDAVTRPVHEVAAETYQTAILAGQVERDRRDVESPLNFALPLIPLLSSARNQPGHHDIANKTANQDCLSHARLLERLNASIVR